MTEGETEVEQTNHQCEASFLLKGFRVEVSQGETLLDLTEAGLSEISPPAWPQPATARHSPLN